MNNILPQIQQLIVLALQFLGGGMTVFGLAQLGLTLKEGATGGGSGISSSIGWIVGGAIVFAAGALFGFLDISWAH